VFFAAVCREHPELALPQWPLWHVSVARLDPRGLRPVPLLLWTPAMHQQAGDVARTVLAHVGDVTREFWESGDVAIHLRRAMTVDEARGLASQIRARRGVPAKGVAS
jgi:hypothetical protein